MIPGFLSEFVRTILIMSMAGSVLALALLAIKPIIRHRLPKIAQYIFWLVALGAFLVPVSRIVTLPAAPINAPIHSVIGQNIISVNEHVNFYTTIAAPPQIAPNVTIAPIVRDTLGIPAPPLSVSLSTVFMLAYPFVGLAVLIISIVGYLRFVGKLQKFALRPNSHELQILKNMTKNSKTPSLKISTYAATPMLIGIFRPIIVLPGRGYSDEQLISIFYHELTHMRRRDIGIKWLSLLACALHWFNPLAWIARREIGRNCELACDEAVISHMDKSGKQNYGETLISVASDKKIPMSVVSTTMCEEKRALKERLAAIMRSRPHTRFTIAISGIMLFAAILAACAMGASGGAPASENNGNTAYSLVADYAAAHISNLAAGLNVAVFEHFDEAQGAHGNFTVRAANIIDHRINRLEFIGEFDNILRGAAMVYRLEFEILTDDIEGGNLRWGTFTPDEQGWIGQHTGWNDARTFLVFEQQGDELTFFGNMPWYYSWDTNESAESLRDALFAWVYRESQPLPIDIDMNLIIDLPLPAPYWRLVLADAFYETDGRYAGLAVLVFYDVNDGGDHWLWHDNFMHSHALAANARYLFNNIDNLQSIGFFVGRGEVRMDYHHYSRSFNRAALYDDSAGWVNLGPGWQEQEIDNLITRHFVDETTFISIAARNWLGYYGEYLWVHEDEGVSAERLMFVPSAILRDFRWLAIEQTDAYPLTFRIAEVLFAADEIRADLAFSVDGWLERGITPHRAIAFTDENGQSHYLALASNRAPDQGGGPYRLIPFSLAP